MRTAQIVILLLTCSGLTGCAHHTINLSEAKQLSAQLKELNNKMVMMQKTVSELQLTAPAASPNLLPLIDLRYAPEKFLIKKVVEASPKISMPNGQFGTGIFISKNGFVLTDLHVVDLNVNVKVIFYTVKENDYNYIYETERMSGTVVAWTKEGKGDLAIIKIDRVPTNVEPLVLASQPALFDSQEIWRFGFNTGYQWTHGCFIANDNKDKSFKQNRVQLPVDKGASGGPLVNSVGEVVGITQNFYESTNEVVTRGDTRLFMHHVSTDLFLPAELIQDFLEEAKIK